MLGFSRRAFARRARYQNEAPFTPTAFSGCVLWLRADRGITFASGKVQQWNDFSGQGFNVSQGTAANQPTYSQNDAGFGGKPVVIFTGANSTFLNNASFAVSQPNTYYFVVSSSDTTQTELLDVASGSTRQFIIRSATGPGNWDFGATTVVDSGFHPSTASIVCVIFNGASSQIYVVNNGTVSTNSGNTGASNMATLSLGSFQGASNFFTGKVAEAIAYSGADSASKRAEIFRYLSNQYAITGAP